jgi:hypothetical protein
MDAQLIQTMGALPTYSQKVGRARAKGRMDVKEVRMANSEALADGDFKVTPTHTNHLRKIAKEMGVELPTMSKNRFPAAFNIELGVYLHKHLEGRPLDPVLREFLSQRDK